MDKATGARGIGTSAVPSGTALRRRLFCREPSLSRRFRLRQVAQRRSDFRGSLRLSTARANFLMRELRLLPYSGGGDESSGRGGFALAGTLITALRYRSAPYPSRGRLERKPGR
jgi:hypothetical protein